MNKTKKITVEKLQLKSRYILNKIITFNDIKLNTEEFF